MTARSWKAAALASACIIAGAGMTLAQGVGEPDAQRLEAARKLLEVTGTAKQFDSLVPKLVNQLVPDFQRRAPKHKKEVGEVLQQMTSKYAPKKSELVDRLARLYATRLSAEDLDALTRFFSEGAGQRYLTSVPDLVESSQRLGQSWGREIAEEIRRDAEAELKKRGAKL